MTAAPGDVLLFDRRLWHARSGNYSAFTRKAVFFGYTYRWIAIRDENDGIWATDWASLSPVQRQLLGGFQPGDGDHAWGHFPADHPAVRLAEGAGPARSGLPAATAVTP